MKVFELTEALKYGLIGFGAILAILSFYLIYREQNKPKPRKQILSSVYIFMGFSLALLLLGLASEVQKGSKSKDIFKSNSGFEHGALNGNWNVQAIDTSVTGNPDFKTSAFRYSGSFTIAQDGNDLVFNGYLDRQHIATDSVVAKRLQFKARGPMNNNYVGAQFYFNDDRKNGFGTILAKFNNDASSADAYLLIRPYTAKEPFGMVYAKLVRAE